MRALLLTLLLASCAPHAAPTTSASAAPIGLATALESDDHPTDTELPDRVMEALSAALTAHDLRPVTLSAMPAAFAEAPSTPARLKLAATDAPQDLLLLVEAHPSFYAQVAGRFRWTVDVTVTLARKDDLANAHTVSWSLPVFLQFSHQREADALSEAAPLLHRRLNAELDAWSATR